MIIDGNHIGLTPDELATAVDAYLTAHNVSVSGPRTVMLVVSGRPVVARDVDCVVIVDPSGRVVDNRAPVAT